MLVWLALALLIGLRRGIGIDWDNYLILFVRAGAYPVPEAMTLSEPGYMLVSAIAARLGFALPVVNLVCAAIFAAGLMMFVRIQKSPALALLIAIPVLVVLVGVAPRQSVAIGLLMAALRSMRPVPGAFPRGCSSLTLLFHWTAILLLPFMAIMSLDRIRLRWIILAGASAGLALAAALWSIPALAQRIALLPQSSGALYRGIPTALALIALFTLWHRLDLDEREERIAAYLAALGLFALLITPAFAMAGDRFGSPRFPCR